MVLMWYPAVLQNWTLLAIAAFCQFDPLCSMRKEISYPFNYAARYVQITHFIDKNGVIDEVKCLTVIK